MRLKFGIFVAVMSATLAVSYVNQGLSAQEPAQEPTAAPAAGASSTWDSVYSEPQAAAGEKIYNDKCAMCHGAEGNGADAPALRGADFGGNWDTMTVGQLFDRIRLTMPQDDPQSLNRDDTASLVAYMLSKNGFPAGSNALPTEGDALAHIKYLANKP